MHVHLMSTQAIIGGFAFVLILIFSVTPFLDKHRRTTAPSREPCSFPQSFVCLGKDGSGALYSRHADLCTCGLGTSEQQICSRGENQQNLAAGLNSGQDP
jgi:hypothetical protein